MARFQIEGGAPLRGEIQAQGAKNEVLQILCAVLLTSEPVRVQNIPDIIDVNKLIEILGDFGVKVQKKSGYRAMPMEITVVLPLRGVCNQWVVRS